MSGNTSASGGFLTPTDDALVEDPELTNLFQATTVGITGLIPQNVRPRWQTTPPGQPDYNVDWCSVGIMSSGPTDYAYQDMQTDGTYLYKQLEALELLWSFYGPNSDANARKLRAGFYIKQNLDLLATAGIKLIEIRETMLVPVLVNTRFIGQTDVPGSFTRLVKRIYPVLPIESANGTIQTADVTVTWDTQNGPLGI